MRVEPWVLGEGGEGRCGAAAAPALPCRVRPPACQALPSRVCRASLSSSVRQPFCPKRGASATMRASRRSRHLWLPRSSVLQGDTFGGHVCKARSACQAL